MRYERRGDRAHIVTKGDANTGFERWSSPLDGTVGLVQVSIPKLGYAVGHLGGRLGPLALIAIPALLLALFELKALWRPKGRDDAV